MLEGSWSWSWKLEGSILGIAFKIHVIKWRKSCSFEAASSKKELGKGNANQTFIGPYICFNSSQKSETFLPGGNIFMLISDIFLLHYPSK